MRNAGEAKCYKSRPVNQEHPRHKGTRRADKIHKKGKLLVVTEKEVVRKKRGRDEEERERESRSGVEGRVGSSSKRACERLKVYLLPLLHEYHERAHHHQT